MKKGLVILMFLLCLLLGGMIVYIRMSDDRTPPRIEVSGEKGKYSSETTEADLLDGVTARDETDGDVTESLVVENVHISEDGENAIITYTAKDSSNNVAKKKVTLACEMDEAPERAGVDEAEAPGNTGKSAEEAAGSAEEDAGKKPAGSADEDAGKQPAGSADENETETDGDAKSQTELSEESPKITLSTNQAVINKGESVNRISFVESITDDKDSQEFLWGAIQIAGDAFDNNTEGTYQQIYYVVDSDGNKSNEETLVIIVR